MLPQTKKLAQAAKDLAHKEEMPDVETIDKHNYTIEEARVILGSVHPKLKVTNQTMRNWAKKFGFGSKDSLLPRSKWIINGKKFAKFVENPTQFLCGKK